MEDVKKIIGLEARIDVLETKIEKISSQVSSCVSLFDRLEKIVEGFCVFVILCVLFVLLTYYWVNQ